MLPLFNIREENLVAPRSDFLQGTLEMLILRVLSDGPQHGYGVARRIQDSSDGVFIIQEGSLYSALYRMERRGWIDSKLGASEHKRRARFYQLTPSGQERLEAKTADWQRSAMAICHMLGLSAPRRLA